MQVILYVAVSLDGYIATTDGGVESVEWLSIVETADGEDYGYKDFYAGVDALVMGRKTYDFCLTMGVDWPYAGKPSYVFTRQTLTTDRDDIHFLSGDVAAGVRHIAQQGYKRLWLEGDGELVRAFLDAGLVDEYIISIIPLILGRGIPLFPAPCKETRLQLVESKSYTSGLVQIHYKSGQ